MPPPPVRKGGGMGLVRIGRRLALDAGRRASKNGRPAKLVSADVARFFKLLGAAQDTHLGAGCSAVVVLAPEQQICRKTALPLLQERNVVIVGAEDMGYEFAEKLTVGDCAVPLPTGLTGGA